MSDEAKQAQRTITEDTFEGWMQNTNTQPAPRPRTQGRWEHSETPGWKQMATCTQLWEVEVTPPMNSVGFRADSNKLKISEPSMSFSPEVCLVWEDKEMDRVKHKRQTHTRPHTHSQLVRQNCRQREKRKEKWRNPRYGLWKQKRMGNKIANWGDHELLFGKAENYQEQGSADLSRSFFSLHCKPQQRYQILGMGSWK